MNSVACGAATIPYVNATTIKTLLTIPKRYMSITASLTKMKTLPKKMMNIPTTQFPSLSHTILHPSHLNWISRLVPTDGFADQQIPKGKPIDDSLGTSVSYGIKRGKSGTVLLFSVNQTSRKFPTILKTGFRKHKRYDDPTPYNRESGTSRARFNIKVVVMTKERRATTFLTCRWTAKKSSATTSLLTYLVADVQLLPGTETSYHY